MITSKRKCPSCGETEFVEGKLGAHVQTFIPRGVWMFLGYSVRGAVCLKCGYLYHFIEEPDLTELRRKVRGSVADLR
jgi:predicted nucleic-acid-binding Zn-ribbon protein